MSKKTKNQTNQKKPVSVVKETPKKDQKSDLKEQNAKNDLAANVSEASETVEETKVPDGPIDNQMTEEMSKALKDSFMEAYKKQTEGELEDELDDNVMILCENLVKIYKTKETEVLALQGLELRVDKGEFIAIIGSSGSGKSTFLNLLGGLDRPSAGKLYVDGKNLFKMTEEQKETEESISNDEPLMTVENMPEFPGGSMAMLQYLSGNIKYPEEARDNNIQGRVIISFIIEKDGSITNAEVVKNVHELLDSEALRCVSAMPAWTPGSHQGKPVRVRYTIPLNFKLNDSDSDFKSVRVSYMKEMNVALFKSCKTPANAAVTVTWENMDNAIDDVINGRREFFEMDYSYYSSIQNALGNHGIDRIKYSADK